MKKVVITGGHLTPALALIEEVRRENWEAYYFGIRYPLENIKKESFEYHLINQRKDISFVNITTGRLQRRFTKRTIVSLLKIPWGIFQSFYWLMRIKPKLIISFGGYLSTPVVISGWLLGIPSISHEQTTSLGLANKINALFSKKVALSFPSTLESVKKSKRVLTGNPIDSQVLQGEAKKSILKKYLEKNKKPLLFIHGGKTGSQIINRNIKKSLKELKNTFRIVHQFGLDPNYEEKKGKDYLAVQFIDNKEFGWLLKKSDLVVTRSGANIVTYLAVTKTKAVLIPIPWSSGNEQKKNALFLEEIGLGRIIEQKNLTPKKLVKTIRQFHKAKIRLNYPNWFKENPPEQAAKKIWKLAKECLNDA